ncbi:MAG: alpha/beta fold hydrolase [Alphaproteobacteria bacterium]|nr:alpha/beta fold hydrolase [Alphaproteobacteria bacterium]
MTGFWSGEYRAQKGDVSLYMLRKRTEAPDAGGRKPLLFLVHGSSFSGPSGFDLHVPGKPGYSLMETFAAFGFDVWTLDHEGYGKSDSTDGNSNIAEGVKDLRAGMEVVRRETGQDSCAFYGSSSGALRAACFAEAKPGAVSKLILDAFVWTGEGSPTLKERAKKLDQWRASSMRPVDRAFFRSIFTRDMPGTSEEGVADALADTELAICNQVPTGTYLDMCAHLPVCDPKKVQCPVLIIRGEHDGIATEEDLLAYFRELPNRDKQFVIIPGQAHVSHLGLNRGRFHHVLREFLTMPERADGSPG